MYDKTISNQETTWSLGCNVSLDVTFSYRSVIFSYTVDHIDPEYRNEQFRTANSQK
jgi:hypothetical protein